MAKSRINIMVLAFGLCATACTAAQANSGNQSKSGDLVLRHQFTEMNDQDSHIAIEETITAKSCTVDLKVNLGQGIPTSAINLVVVPKESRITLEATFDLLTPAIEEVLGIKLPKPVAAGLVHYSANITDKNIRGWPR